MEGERGRDQAKFFSDVSGRDTRRTGLDKEPIGRQPMLMSESS